MMYKLFHSFAITVFLFICIAEPSATQNNPDPRGAFLRSLAVPGWGHYYADKESWTRGQVHLGTEAVLIVSYFGFRHRANRLETQFLTLANLRSGVDISERGRSFQLAIGEFNSLQEYNDFQLRSRNWNRLFEETRENNWQWQNEEDRSKYSQLRSDRERARNQLPAILGLMTVNRVFSAISAYNRAREQSEMPEITFSPIINENGSSGAVATVSFRF